MLLVYVGVATHFPCRCVSWWTLLWLTKAQAAGVGLAGDWSEKHWDLRCDVGIFCIILLYIFGISWRRLDVRCVLFDIYNYIDISINILSTQWLDPYPEVCTTRDLDCRQMSQLQCQSYWSRTRFRRHGTSLGVKAHHSDSWKSCPKNGALSVMTDFGKLSISTCEGLDPFLFPTRIVCRKDRLCSPKGWWQTETNLMAGEVGADW